MGEGNKYAERDIALRIVMFMSEEDFRKELVELRERVVKLEVKIEELSKRVESLANYARELYGYLQSQRR